MEAYEEEVMEIDLRQVFFALWNRIWVIVLSAAALALAAFLYTQLCITPMYRSVASLYILNRQNSGSIATSSDVSAATSLTNDFKALVKSRAVLVQTIEELNLNMSEETLSSMISVSNQSGTRILDIYVTDSNPYRTKEIADTVAKIACTEVVEIMELEKANIANEAKVPTQPISPDKKRNVVMGAFAGAVLSAMAVLAMFFLDDTFKSEEEIERVLQKSVLGVIPLEENKQKKRSKNKVFKGGAKK